MSDETRMQSVASWLALPVLPIKRIQTTGETGSIYSVTKVGVMVAPRAPASAAIGDLDGAATLPGAEVILPTATVAIEGGLLLHRLPLPLGHWAMHAMGCAAQGFRLFPSKVAFSELEGHFTALYWVMAASVESLNPFADQQVGLLEYSEGYVSVQGTELTTEIYWLPLEHRCGCCIDWGCDARQKARLAKFFPVAARFPCPAHGSATGIAAPPLRAHELRKLVVHDLFYQSASGDRHADGRRNRNLALTRAV